MRLRLSNDTGCPRFAFSIAGFFFTVLIVFNGTARGMDQQPDNSQSKTTTTSGTMIDKAARAHLKTLGGRQFWGDLTWFHGWRIQQHVLTKHCRLIDPEDYRACSGSLEQCRAALKDVQKKSKQGPVTGHVVIMVHGIIRSSKSFTNMQKVLRDQGLVVIGFDYPSTQEKITDSVHNLHSVIGSLPNVQKISFVCHSMGGLLVRSYLKSHRDQRLHRMVMLGVPNNGAKMADLMKNSLLFKGVFGPAGQQLVSDPAGYIKTLPVPDFEFGIIAGGRGNDRGFNPLIPGDDDMTVSVASTQLPGARDFLLVNSLHSFMMNHKDVIQATARFLKQGHFRAGQPAQPIE